MIFWATALTPHGDDELFGGTPTPLVRIMSDGKSGVGFFIHPLVVVTCAHNVVREWNGKLFPPKKVWFESPAATLWPEWMVVPDELSHGTASIVPYADVAAFRVRSAWQGPVARIGALPPGNQARVWRLEQRNDVTFTVSFPYLEFRPASPDWSGSSGAPLVSPRGPLEHTAVVAIHRLFSNDEGVGKALQLSPDDAFQMLSALGI